MVVVVLRIFVILRHELLLYVRISPQISSFTSLRDLLDHWIGKALPRKGNTCFS